MILYGSLLHGYTVVIVPEIKTPRREHERSLLFGCNIYNSDIVLPDVRKLLLSNV